MAIYLGNKKILNSQVRLYANQVNIDGSPRGKFDTIEALNSAYPNGDKVPYLVGNNIYIWNGLAWEYVGVYQATDISDNSVSYSKLNNTLKSAFDYTETKLVNEVNIAKVGFQNSTKLLFSKAILKKGKTLKSISFNSYTTDANITVSVWQIGDDSNTLTKVFESGEINVLGNQIKTFDIDFYIEKDSYLAVRNILGQVTFGNSTTGMYQTASLTDISNINSLDMSTFESFNQFGSPLDIVVYEIEAGSTTTTTPTTKSQPDNVLTVGKNNCDFTEIQDAINSISDDSANNHYTILVNSGTYKPFHTWVYGVKPVGTTRYISIVGTDRENCIVKGVLNSSFFCNGELSNLTLISTDEVVDVTGLTKSIDYDSIYGYALHIDMNNSSQGMKILVRNCHIISYKGASIGMGTWDNDVITFENCLVERLTGNTIINHVSSTYAIYCHNAQYGAQHQNVSFINCNFKSNYTNCAYFQDTIPNAETQSLLYLEFINNVMYSNTNGFNSITITTKTDESAFSGKGIKLSTNSFGNSNSKLNNSIGN